MSHVYLMTSAKMSKSAWSLPSIRITTIRQQIRKKKWIPLRLTQKKKSKIKGCQRYITIKKSLPLAANINWKPSSSLKKYDRNVKKVNNLTSYWLFIFSWIKEDYILLTCLLCCTSDFKFLKINEEKTQCKYSYHFSNWVILFLRIVSLGVYHI